MSFDTGRSSFRPYGSLVLDPKASLVFSDPPLQARPLPRTFEISIVSLFFRFVKGFRAPISISVSWLPPLGRTVGRLLADFQSGERRLYPLLTISLICDDAWLSGF